MASKHLATDCWLGAFQSRLLCLAGFLRKVVPEVGRPILAALVLRMPCGFGCCVDFSASETVENRPVLGCLRFDCCCSVPLGRDELFYRADDDNTVWLTLRLPDSFSEGLQ